MTKPAHRRPVPTQVSYFVQSARLYLTMYRHFTKLCTDSEVLKNVVSSFLKKLVKCNWLHYTFFIEKQSLK